MTFNRFALPLTLALAALAPLAAQTQLVRGDIDTIQGTNLFRLDCTQNVRLVSNTLNLQALHDASRQQDIEYEMQVVDVSVPGQTILEVQSATAVPEQFGMGNLRLGDSATWEVFASPGSPVWVFIGARVNTAYQPLGSNGTWILGGDTTLFQTGQTNALGRFQFNFTMPNMPVLVGLEVSAQSVVRDSGVFVVTNPDCKEIRD
jgi:hypothetical protein